MICDLKFPFELGGRAAVEFKRKIPEAIIFIFIHNLQLANTF